MMFPKNLNELQMWARDWVAKNFPGQPKWHCLVGLQEELGELAHAFLKSDQGIRGTAAEHHKAMYDAVGDILIYLASFCNANGIDLQTAAHLAHAEVERRDWKKFPKNGVSE